MNDRASKTADGGRTGILASFARFVLCGGSTGVASGLAISATDGLMPVAIANAGITIVSTVVATELHSRVTFRDGRTGWRVHAQSGFTALVCYLFTTAAMLVLQATNPDAGVLLTQVVYLSASGLAGIGRFVALRVFVFARPRARSADAALSPRRSRTQKPSAAHHPAHCRTHEAAALTRGSVVPAA